MATAKLERFKVAASGEPQNVADEQALGQGVWVHGAEKKRLALGSN